MADIADADPVVVDSRPAMARRADKVSEVVARAIVHDIVSRGLEPGATLPSEAVMLARFQVGRASLREALRILEVHGLITIKPGPGGGPFSTASGTAARTWRTRSSRSAATRSASSARRFEHTAAATANALIAGVSSVPERRPGGLHSDKRQLRPDCDALLPARWRDVS